MKNLGIPIFYFHIIKKCMNVAILIILLLFSLDFLISTVSNIEDFSKGISVWTILKSFAKDSYIGVVDYFEIAMLLSALISLSLFKEANNLEALRSAGTSPIKIILITAISPFILSIIFILGESLISKNLSHQSRPNNDWAQTNTAIIKTNEESSLILLHDKNLSVKAVAKTHNGGSKMDLIINKDQKYTNEILNISFNDNLDEFPTNYLFKTREILFLPFTTLSIIFLASIFIFNVNRSFGVGRAIFIGVMFGFVYSICKDLLVAIFNTYNLPVLIAILILPLTAMSAGIYWLKRAG